jgi:3-isopropylmalate dehydrogenase
VSAKRYTVACLAGDGIGPELTAEACRLVAAVSRFHGFVVDDVHPAFGGEAFVRYGHPLPRATRDACLDADAVLVAAPREPALGRLEDELDLRAAVTWVRTPTGGDLLLMSPLTDDASRWTVERAFDLARRRRAHVASVDAGRGWRDLVDEVAEGHDGLGVEHLSVGSGLPALAFDRERFDVVVTGELFADALVEVATSSEQRPRVVASARIAEHGPGIFLPAHGAARQIAGQGVANPSSMLLAAALMLGVGLGEQSAAETLQGAVLGAFGNRVRTPDMRGRGIAGTTRDFTKVVIDQLPTALQNAEFLQRATA